MNKKYQVFISSTYTDLIDARAKVRDAILSMYHFPVGMELFGAANEEQWQIISETIDSSDYYVLIIGQRYGSLIEEESGMRMSYTEKEFRYAIEKGIPVLAFLLDDSVPVLPEYIEKKYPEKLEAFKNEVKKGRLVEWWQTPDELAKKVTTALYKQISRKERPGWIRGDSVDIEKSLSEIVELSKQNRELQEMNKRLNTEIEKLRSATSRKPRLTVAFECAQPDDNEEYPELYERNDIIEIDEDEVIHLKLKEISTKSYMEEYQRLSIEDAPPEVKPYISEKEIRAYNDALPSDEELQKYCEALLCFLRLKENGVPITIFVDNIGNAKATDVSVTISFPDQVRVFDISEIEKIDELKGPTKPENPFDKAKKRLERERAHALDLKVPGFSFFGGVSDGRDYSSFISELPKLAGNSVYESVDISNNTVDIVQRQGIVHTKYDWFSGAYIVPIVPGEFEAKATIMCAEYEEPEEMTIKFVVAE